MDDALLELILDRLDSEPLEPGPAALLLAACEGAAALDAAVVEGSRSSEATRSPAVVRRKEEPAGAWLNSISVRGFRGVGPECTLPVEPGPGLTLVVGRNGSGKSSFAEGLEALLTGSLRRWDDRSSVWKESWRNLHSDDEVWVSADLSTAQGATTLERRWPRGAEFDKGVATMQVHGKKRVDLFDLGWDAALEAYRPLLSHAELEAFFGRPTDLYELLSQVLGLEDLVDTAKHLAEARKQAESHSALAKKALPALTKRLEEIDDERAAKVLAALGPRKWDLDEVEAAVTGSASGESGSEHEWLRRVTQLRSPDLTRCGEAAEALRLAADRLDGVRGSEAGKARQLADLLEAAVEHYEADHQSDCPVCGTAEALGAEWGAQARERIEALRREAGEATQAHRAADESLKSARSLLTAPPSLLSDPRSDRLDVNQVLGLWQKLGSGARWRRTCRSASPGRPP